MVDERNKPSDPEDEDARPDDERAAERDATPEHEEESPPGEDDDSEESGSGEDDEEAESDEDDEEAESDEDDEEAEPDEDDEEAESDEDDDDEPSGDDDEGEAAATGDDDEEHADERAGAVARALRVTEDETAPAGGEKAADEGPKNRAARRRELALARRKGKGGVEVGEMPAVGTAAAPRAGESKVREPERDRNKRLRDELLAKRREAASSKPAAAQGLAASEMAEDVLVRGMAGVTKWLSRHRSGAGWGLFAALALTAAVLYYFHHTSQSLASGADALARAVIADQALVVKPEEDTRPEEQRADDPRKFFASGEERSKAALEGYDKVLGEHPGTGAAMLAQLGRAGIMLEQQKWDGAVEAYTAVLGSQLAPADGDVRARALEGLGFAKEGKGDLEGALGAFKQLEEIPGFKGLGLYHRGRVLARQDGKRDDAKKVLIEARDLVDKANIEARATGTELQFRWLIRSIEDTLRVLDPKLIPLKAGGPPGGGAPQMTKEQMRKMLQQQGLPPVDDTPQRPGDEGE